MVFSAEINCIYLLWGFLLLPILLFISEEVYHLVTNSYFNVGDTLLGIITYAVLCTYAGIGARRFYKTTKWQSVGFAILFYIAHVIIVQFIYKFILFYIVIHQIHQFMKLLLPKTNLLPIKVKLQIKVFKEELVLNESSFISEVTAS